MAEEVVLVIDDGRENREFIIEYILRPNGYQALEARDGREGLQIISQYKPDIILLDYQMPRMNGIDVLYEMNDRGWNIPVILMTFYGSEEVAVEVYRLGVRDYIKKPFTPDEMLSSIERHLTEVRLRKERDGLTERLLNANRELQNRLQELNVLYSVGKSVTALANLHQLLPRIVDAAVRVTNAEECYLYLKIDQQITCVAQKQRHSPTAESTNRVIQNPVITQVMQMGQVVTISPNTPAARGLNAHSIAATPIMLRNQSIGALEVRNISNTSHTFTNHESALLRALTDYAAIAIQNIRTMDALRTSKENEKERIHSLFQRFVPPRVVDLILEDQNVLQLGGKRREISVLFADIRGYTSYSENLPPETVVEMLNDYLSLAANVIMGYGGTLDKYIGDGLMAIFNAPDDDPNHLGSAMEAAIMLQQASQQLAAQRGDGLTFSIGVHSGEAVVGFIGTDCAMNYTAVGDTVNLAKRLQELAKPGQLIVEESTVNQLGNTIRANLLGELKLKGRNQQVRVYEILAVAPS